MKIYIAGPITGMPNHNEQAFADAERRLRENGEDPVNPFTIANRLSTVYGEIQKSFDALYSNPYSKESELARRMIDMDIKELSKCDAIYLLPGWRKSKGTLNELQHARKLGLAVIDSEGINPC